MAVGPVVAVYINLFNGGQCLKLAFHLIPRGLKVKVVGEIAIV